VQGDIALKIVRWSLAILQLAVTR